MDRAKLPANELDRLAALRACNILDTPAEPEFDDITKLAASICQVPIALVTLLDEHRQWFKSKVGLCITGTHRDVAFCGHAILADEPLIVRDALADDRFKDNLLVVGEPHIRFYAGVPLRSSDGFAMGTLCVIDTVPRDLLDAQLDSLKQLARQVTAAIEMRRRADSGERLCHAIEGKRSGLIGRAAVAVFCGSMLMTTLAVVHSYRSSMAVAQQRFARMNDRVCDEITRRVNLPGYGLKGARGVYAASESVERHEFAAYVASRNLQSEFPGVLGFGFIERVMRSELPSFIAREQSDEAPDFSVTSLSDAADDLYVIKFIYPQVRNAAALGFDIGSEANRREAVEHAVLTGESTITPSITLQQDVEHHHGFLYFVPVYKSRWNPQTPAERLASLQGVVFAPIILDDALRGLFEATDGLVSFEVFDNVTIDPSKQVYDDSNRAAPQPANWLARAYQNQRFTTDSTVLIGSRTWSVRTRATPKFDTIIEKTTSIAIGIGGTLLSLLLAAVVGLLSRGRARAFALANRMTADVTAAKDRAERAARELQVQSTSLQTRTEQLEAAGAMLRRTGQMARVGGWEVVLATQQVLWSDEVYRIHEVLRGTPISLDAGVNFYAPSARRQIKDAVAAAICSGRSWDLELPLVTAKGRQIFVRAQGEAIRQNGKTVRLCGAFQDITVRKLAEEELRRSATHDKLTGLANRALINDRLQQCVSRFAWDPSQSFAVLFMDFDRFKQTNDTLGHEAGDDLLRQIATRLRGCLTSGETSKSGDPNFSTIGRLGGDEFVVILDQISGLSDAVAVGDKLVSILAAPYTILGHSVVSTASIGIVASSDRYMRAEDMLRDADIAMYEAKLAGKGRHITFDAAMHEKIQRRVQIESDLRQARSSNQLFLAYQPVISLADGTTRGVEALLRWQHPTRGLIAPDELMPIAEETGQIIPIGEWVLRQACMQFMEWRRTLGAAAPHSISVNLSRKQLAIANLPQTIQSILSDTAMPAECLHLEVTESAVMRDPKITVKVLQSLRAIGVKLVLDDFGTGHSSMAMLHELPVDVLKIDRSFVRNLERGREFAALVQAIAQLARNLGMAVVAEGVETIDQLAMLQTIDCELGQGYFFTQPMTAAEVATFVSGPTDWTAIALTRSMLIDAA